MRCRRLSLESDIHKYETGKGMEDGFELWTDIVTKGWIVTDFLVKVTREDGMIVCPYIKNRRGYTFIGEIISLWIRMEPSTFAEKIRSGSVMKK